MVDAQLKRCDFLTTLAVWGVKLSEVEPVPVVYCDGKELVLDIFQQRGQNNLIWVAKLSKPPRAFDGAVGFYCDECERALDIGDTLCSVCDFGVCSGCKSNAVHLHPIEEFSIARCYEITTIESNKLEPVPTSIRSSPPHFFFQDKFTESWYYKQPAQHPFEASDSKRTSKDIALDTVLEWPFVLTIHTIFPR